MEGEMAAVPTVETLQRSRLAIPSKQLLQGRQDSPQERIEHPNTAKNRTYRTEQAPLKNTKIRHQPMRTMQIQPTRDGRTLSIRMHEVQGTQTEDGQGPQEKQAKPQEDHGFRTEHKDPIKVCEEHKQIR